MFRCVDRRSQTRARAVQTNVPSTECSQELLPWCSFLFSFVGFGVGFRCWLSASVFAGAGRACSRVWIRLVGGERCSLATHATGFLVRVPHTLHQIESSRCCRPVI